MSEPSSAPPIPAARRAATARAASFATVESVVSPAPWLVDGGRVLVRPLFALDDAEGEVADERALEPAPAPPSGAGPRPALTLPPAAASPAVAAPPPPPPAPSSSAPPARDPSADLFARAVAEHVTARARALVAVEEQLLGLAVQLAEVLVERELASDPELHAVLARAALAAVEGSQPGVVRASRAAHAAIVDAFGAALVEVDGVQVPVALDPRLDGLGVVVDGAEARVDGRVGERLRSALRAMQDERRRREAEVAT